MQEEAIIALQNSELSTKEKMALVASNQDDRLTIITAVQQHTFNHIFLKNQDDFFTTKFHYDWWIFPMHVPTEWQWQKRNYDASIDLDEAKLLASDQKFCITYFKSVRGYINALESKGWNDYPVRYARMLQSLDLFIQAAKEAGREIFCSKLHEQGQRAIDYAAKNSFRSIYPHYDLLMSGLEKIQSKLEPQDCPEATSTTSNCNHQ